MHGDSKYGHEILKRFNSCKCCAILDLSFAYACRVVLVLSFTYVNKLTPIRKREAFTLKQDETSVSGLV